MLAPYDGRTGPRYPRGLAAARRTAGPKDSGSGSSVDLGQTVPHQAPPKRNAREAADDDGDARSNRWCFTAAQVLIGRKPLRTRRG